MIHIAITTYNRPEMLNKLLADLDHIKAHVYIYNDGSTVSYPVFTAENLMITQINYSKNHGRKNYYKLVNDIFERARATEWDYFFMLPDDIRLKEGFFDVINLWKELHSWNWKCLTLSVGHTHDRIEIPNWTGFVPEEMGAVVKTQWNDLCFMCDRNFIDVIHEIKVSKNRWKRNPELGSGVGQFISINLHERGFNMYHTKDSLVEFTGAINGEKSQMFRDES